MIPAYFGANSIILEIQIEIRYELYCSSTPLILAYLALFPGMVRALNPTDKVNNDMAKGALQPEYPAKTTVTAGIIKPNIVLIFLMVTVRTQPLPLTLSVYQPPMNVITD